MVRRFTGWVGKWPLAGKVVIKPLVFNVYCSRSEGERRENFCFCVVVLGFLILAHGYQAWLGYNALNFDAPIWAKVISAGYLAINASVVVAQIDVLYRVIKYFTKGVYLRGRKSYREYTAEEKRWMMGITLGGQIIFICQYGWFFST